MGNILRCLEVGNPMHWPDAQPSSLTPLPLARPEPPHIDNGGTTEVKLADGAKSPDCCFWDKTPVDDERLKNKPTVVIEVRWTQTSEELAKACSRWIAASFAQVNLAIAIDIIMLQPQKTKDIANQASTSTSMSTSTSTSTSTAKAGKSTAKEGKSLKKLAQLWCSVW